jgi:hypothetical protein
MLRDAAPNNQPLDFAKKKKKKPFQFQSQHQHQHHHMRTVSARPTALLVELLHGLGDGVMDHKPHVSLVDAHPKGNLVMNKCKSK